MVHISLLSGKATCHIFCHSRSVPSLFLCTATIITFYSFPSQGRECICYSKYACFIGPHAMINPGKMPVVPLFRWPLVTHGSGLILKPQYLWILLSARIVLYLGISSSFLLIYWSPEIFVLIVVTKEHLSRPIFKLDIKGCNSNIRTPARKAMWLSILLLRNSQRKTC